MNLTPQNRQRLLTILALVAIGFWVGDKLLLTPLTESWRKRSAAIVELRKKTAQGRQLRTRERAIHERWDSMRTNTLPAQKSVAESRVIKAFDEWSRESRISVTSIKPQWRQNDEGYETLECRVDAFGSIANVTRLLYEVEKDPLALRVESVELRARDNDGSQLTVGLQVSGLLLNPAQP